MPKVYDLAGNPVKILFAPDHTPELEIMKQLLEGQDEVYFAIFTFAGSSGIDDAMLALARGGMRIQGVLDPGQARQKWAAPRWLTHPNIKLYVPRRDGVFAHLRKVHHKLMVIHEQVVIAGSFDYRPGQRVQRREHLRPRLGARRGRGNHRRGKPLQAPRSAHEARN